MNVNRSSYYKHFHSPLPKREVENQTLRTKILRLYNASDKRLGAKKMRLLAEYGINISVDLFARKVIAWRVSSVSNAKFVTELLLTAWNLRKKPKSVIFHSDRGSQYTSKDFRQTIDRLGFSQSFSKPGCPYDNAVAEAFFKYLKKEETNRRTFCKIDEVKYSVMHYIDGYYNKKRPHEANRGLSPDEKEAEFWTENE